MVRWGSRPGVAAAAVGAAMLAQAALARLLLAADEVRVYVLGHPVDWVCGLRSRFGLPCPTCGLTRSLVLSLHGEVGPAWRLAPAGPVVVFGGLALAAALLVLAGTQWRAAREWERSAAWWIRRGALVYTSAAVVVWIGGWAVQFRAAWPGL